MRGNEQKKKKSFLTLPRKLTIIVIVLHILVAVVLGLLFSHFLNIKVESDNQKYIANVGNISSGIINDYVNAKNAQLNMITSMPEINNFIAELRTVQDKNDIKNIKSYERVQAMLNDISYDNDSIISAWIASDVSGVIVGSDENFMSAKDINIHEQSWYRSFISHSNNSNMHYNTAKTKSMFDSNVEVASIISAVYENENHIGYCGIEINVDTLRPVLEKYRVTNDCYVTIVCDYGTIVYSPSWDDGFVKKQQLLLSLIVQANSYSDGIDSYVDVNGDETHFYIDNSSIDGWSILVFFNENAEGIALKSLAFKIYIVVLCFMALFCMFIVNRIKNEARHMPEIEQMLKVLSKGQYTNELKIERHNSMYIYGKTLNKINEIIHVQSDKLEKANYTDGITGLPNRIKLYEYLEDLISVADDTKIRFALMFVDIDNFKWLNETLGHTFGDTVLLEFGSMLADTIKNDGKVFRFGGDEYIILVEFGEDASKIDAITAKLKATFEKPLKVLNDSIYVKFSIGVSIFPYDDVLPDLLLRDADMALHRSKENGKNRVSFYTNTMQKHSLSKAAISQRLANALQNNELYLNYQPIISTTTGDIYGFEVLLRWDSPEFGFVPPTEFIDVAEETGLIVQIGTWIFESACRFLKELCDNYRDDIIMSINVSPVQLKRADYMEHISRVIDITQVDTKNIQIEITESTLIDFVDSNTSTIDQINEMGISLALDDFGTGYSSLNYLKNFPIKCLKIDKSFVDEINNNQRDYAITDSIIDLVHNLGIKTVAEGIETVGQYKFLTKMNCDYIQGFLMSKPLDEEAAFEFVSMYDALHKPDDIKLSNNEKQLENEREQQRQNESNEDKSNTKELM